MRQVVTKSPVTRPDVPYPFRVIHNDEVRDDEYHPFSLHALDIPHPVCAVRDDESPPPPLWRFLLPPPFVSPSVTS